jgi:ankyrin repeat protein
MATRKTCPACGQRLSAAAFNQSARTSDGLAHTCRACTNARRRQLARTDNRAPRRSALSTLLASSLRRGDVPAVRKLIRHGLTPHWGWICETMREGHLDVAEALLRAGVERNVFTRSAMADSAGLSRSLARNAADARLTASMEPASDGVTPLHVACASDWKPLGDRRQASQVRVAEILFEHGADLEATALYRGIAGATPLFCACWSSENPALARWFLERGAHADESHLAAALGHLQRHGREAWEIADLLVERGVRVDGRRAGERTLLHAFAHQGNHRTVAWLLAHGADVHARGPGGRTALHFAAERNTGPKTLALLVEHGADLSVRDDDGHTPLQVAELNGKPRLVEWIKRHTV